MTQILLFSPLISPFITLFLSPLIVTARNLPSSLLLSPNQTTICPAGYYLRDDFTDPLSLTSLNDFTNLQCQNWIVEFPGNNVVMKDGDLLLQLTKDSYLPVGREAAVSFAYWIQNGRVCTRLRTAIGQGVITQAKLDGFVINQPQDDQILQLFSGKSLNSESTGYTSGKVQGGNYNLQSSDVDSNTAEWYHEYCITRTANYIDWSLDGKSIRRLNKGADFPANVSRFVMSVFDGGWEGMPSQIQQLAGGKVDWSSSTSPNYIAYIDWVEIACQNQDGTLPTSSQKPNCPGRPTPSPTDTKPATQTVPITRTTQSKTTGFITPTPPKTTTTKIPTPVPPPSPSSGLSTGAIAGIVVGSVVGIAAIASLTAFGLSKSKKKQPRIAIIEAESEIPLVRDDKNDYGSAGESIALKQQKGIPVSSNLGSVPPSRQPMNVGIGVGGGVVAGGVAGGVVASNSRPVNPKPIIPPPRASSAQQPPIQSSYNVPVTNVVVDTSGLSSSYNMNLGGGGMAARPPRQIDEIASSGLSTSSSPSSSSQGQNLGMVSGLKYGTSSGYIPTTIIPSLSPTSTTSTTIPSLSVDQEGFRLGMTTISTIDEPRQNVKYEVLPELKVTEATVERVPEIPPSSNVLVREEEGKVKVPERKKVKSPLDSDSD